MVVVLGDGRKLCAKIGNNDVSTNSIWFKFMLVMRTLILGNLFLKIEWKENAMIPSF